MNKTDTGMRTARAALLIDAENVGHLRADQILSYAEAEGDIAIKEAYGDWSSPSLKGWVAQARLHGIRAVEQVSAGRKKNSSDCAFTVGAMDMHFTCPWISTFVLATSDGDFTALAAYLVRAGHRVVGIGAEEAPGYFKSSVTEFRQLDEGIPAPAWASAEDELSVQVKEALRRIARKGGWWQASKLRMALNDVDNGAFKDFDTKTLGYAGFESWLKATGMYATKSKKRDERVTLFKLEKTRHE